MKSIPAVLRITAITLAVGAIGFSAYAGGLKHRLIPKSSGWYAHVDVEALTESTLGSCLLAAAKASGDADLAQVKEELGIDPFEDVYSVTIYGVGDGGPADITGEDAVALLVTTPAIDKLLENLAEQEGYQRIEQGGLALHSFSDDDDDDDDDERWYVNVQKASNDRRVVIASMNKDAVVDGVAVAKGNKPGKADRDGAEGALVLFSTSSLDGLGEGSPASQVLGRAKQLRLVISEEEGVVHAQAGLQLDSDEYTQTVVDLINGILAMARMAANAEDDEEAEAMLELASGIELKADGDKLGISIKVSAEMLCTMIEHAGELRFSEIQLD